MNSIGAVVDARGFAAFAESSPVPLYASAWRTVFVPALPAWPFLLVILEMAIGLVILFTEPLRRYGFLAALMFALALVPTHPMTIGNLFLAAAAAWLLAQETRPGTRHRLI